jgi:hypothetical protein
MEVVNIQKMMQILIDSPAHGELIFLSICNLTHKLLDLLCRLRIAALRHNAVQFAA